MGENTGPPKEIPDGSQDNSDRPAGVSRRAFLEGAAVAAGAAAAFASGFGAGRASGGSEAPGHEETVAPATGEVKIYTSGEVIETPGGRVLIEGWQVLIDREELKRISGESYRREMGFRLFRPGEEEPVEVFPYHWQGWDVEKEGKNYVAISVSPARSRFDENPILFFVETERDFNSETKKFENERLLRFIPYPIRPKVYQFNTEDARYKAPPRPRFLSEVDLGETNFREIEALIDTFEHFTYRIPRVYIRSSVDGWRGSSYNPDANRVSVPENLFTDPKHKTEGLASLCHELAHGIFYNDVVGDQRDQRLSVQLFQAYQRLVEVAGYRIPMPTFGLFGPPQEVEENRLFSMFDESAYTPEIERLEGTSGHGHPYHNFNELFASGLSVLRYFPKEFIERYQQLSEEDQEVVKEVTQAIYAIVTKFRDAAKYLPWLLPNQELPRLLDVKIPINIKPSPFFA